MLRIASTNPPYLTPGARPHPSFSVHRASVCVWGHLSLLAEAALKVRFSGHTELPTPFLYIESHPQGCFVDPKPEAGKAKPSIFESFLQVVVVHRATGESALVVAFLSLCGDLLQTS